MNVGEYEEEQMFVFEVYQNEEYLNRYRCKSIGEELHKHI